MEAFGYDKNDEEFDNLIKLREVTFSCQKEDIDKIIDFLTKARSEMENINLEYGVHWHYRDYNKSWEDKDPDLIIYIDNDATK